MTYLPGLYTPLDPPDAEVRLEDGGRMRGRREKRRCMVSATCQANSDSDAVLAFR